MEQEAPIYDFEESEQEEACPFEADLCALIASLRRVATVCAVHAYY